MFSNKALAAVGLALGIAATSNAQQGVRPKAVLSHTEVSIGYSYMRANATPGNCGCFSLHGGNAEAAVPVYRHFSVVFDLTGEHTGTTSIPNQQLSLVTFTAGPRFSYAVRHNGRTRVAPFVQGLVGAVHGFDAPFPTSSRTTTLSATNLAVLLGGGIDVPVTRHVAIRAVQADYGLTHLPNNANNSQHLLRIATGVVFHFN